MNLACPECGNRQSDGTRCTACGYDGVLALDNEQHVELLRDIDERRRERHSARVRIFSVIVAMAIVFGLWLVPGYWGLRGSVFPGLPLFADQWGLMIIIALVLWKLLERLAPKPRFPYLAK